MSRDSTSDEEDIFRPFSGKIGKQTAAGIKFAPGTTTAGTLTSKTEENEKKHPGQHKSLLHRTNTLHRMNTSAKNDFWSVLRQKKKSAEEQPPAAGSDLRKKLGAPAARMAAATKIIMQEERVIKLFMKVEKMKDSNSRPDGLPNI